MTKNELWKLYCDTEKKFERAKQKRLIKTVAFFAVAIFLCIYFIEKPTGSDIIGNLLVSVVLAGIYVVVNAAIFGQLANVSEGERRALENIKKRIDEAD